MASDLVEEVPRFLNEAYIEGLVKKVEKSDKVKLEKFELRPVTKKGNHYASVMVRIIVDYVIESKNHKQVSLILKTTYDENNDKEALELLKSFDIHSREMLMYRKILDDFHNLLLSINDTTVFSARRYCEDQSTNTLVFEDLLERDYRCANRIERLDLNHAKLALRKLAKFHAASIVHRKKEPKAYDTFNKAFLSRDDNMDTREFCLKNYDALLKVVSEWPGYEYYVDKLTKFRGNFIEKGIELYDPNNSEFNVLLHGDFWTNNMMYKYDSANNPVDVIFVDFQMPYWTTPAVDILYFIHTSMKEDLRIQKQDELVQFYYNNLKETLIDGFKYEGKFLTLHEFQVMILRNSLQILVSAFIVQPIILLDEKIDSDMFLLMATDEKGLKFAENLYRNPNIEKAVKNVLPLLDTKGILD